MAKSNELPGFREKRKVLFGPKTSPKQMRDMGVRFMEAERYDDALEFFARTEAKADVKEIVRIAMDRGDTPLLLRARLVLGETPAEKELLACARKAEAAGRKSMAVVAYSKAGNEEEAERLRAEISASLEPDPPAASEGVPEAAPPAGDQETGGDAEGPA
ncbi:MAG: hypothetical protein QGH74_06410 [Candidatus Brocadiia bacterium]|jgi:hypothetical protein|nr:hypothetical protein [Candidatus Brocadiia bacterium]